MNQAFVQSGLTLSAPETQPGHTTCQGQGRLCHSLVMKSIESHQYMATHAFAV